MLCGLLTPDAGEGQCLGFDVRKEAQAIKERVGYMTQKFSLYEDLSIRENLDFVARMYRRRPAQGAGRRGADGPRPRRPRKAARRHAVGRLEAAAGARGLPACTTRNCCCSTSRRPASIPRRGATSGTRSGGSRRTGVTVLVSTHYMDEAVQCDFIAYIAYGKKLIDGPTGEITEAGRARRPGASRARTLRRWRRGSRAAPASCRSRGSARRSTSRAPTRRRSGDDGRGSAAEGTHRVSEQPRRHRGGLHLPDGGRAGQLRA